MTTRRTATIAAGIAAGTVVLGVVGRTVVRRRHEHQEAAGVHWELPPDDLGFIRSFDGTGIAVRAAGDPDKPVLVFAHGFSLDMTTWLDQWRDLSDEFRCVLMDHRSHGGSERAAHDDLTLRSMGRDVAAVLEATSPNRPAVLVGHSMGGMAILAMAEQRPELFGPAVAGVVLIGSSSSDLFRGAMGSVTDLLRLRLSTIGTAVARVDRLRKAVLASPADLSGAIARLTQFGPDAPLHVVDHVVALAQRTSSQVWTDGLAELMEVDLAHAIPRVRVPALVLVGEHDRVTPPAAALALTAALPDGRLIVIEGAGHIAMLERPQELNLQIRRFADEVLGSASPPKPQRKPRRRPKDAGEPAA
ncbi:MAG: alpha/beta hydrolase [Actinomycetota bacterium]|nr:alpha/beta hydrolase [Actinomycetota bacterium]